MEENMQRFWHIMLYYFKKGKNARKVKTDRPVEVDSSQIKALLENSQHYTTWEIANITQNIQSNKMIGEK